MRFVIKLIIICFENNIECLLNVNKWILLNGIGQCDIEAHDIHIILTLALQLGVKA